MRLVVIAFHTVVCASTFLACSSQLPEPRSTTQPESAFSEVDYPPPPARVEFVPAKSSASAVWVNGEWLWSGRRWSWRPGAWVVPPEGASYARRALVRRDGGKLLFAPGAWRDKQGEEVAAPPEKSAGARSGAVINAEGETEPVGPDVHADAGADGNEPSRDDVAPDAGSDR
jgi:hypothetical protein